MTSPTPTSKHAFQSLGLQSAVTVAAALLLLPFVREVSVAIILGGLIAIAGNALAILVVFRQYQAADPGALASRMMGAELGRLILAGVGFGLVFAWGVPVNVPVLFGAFLIVHLLPVWWLHRAKIQTNKR